MKSLKPLSLLGVLAGLFVMLPSSFAEAQQMDQKRSQRTKMSDEFSLDDIRFEDDEPSDFKPVTLSVNPLGLLFGLVGGNLEYVVTPHHGLVVSPFYHKLGFLGLDFETVGSEVGYRFYTGRQGASGFFVGPSLLYSRTTVSYKCSGYTSCSEDEYASSYGMAVDVGGQAIFKSGLTLGAGLGVAYHRSGDNSFGEGFKFDGTFGRLFANVGYSF